MGKNAGHQKFQMALRGVETAVLQQHLSLCLSVSVSLSHWAGPGISQDGLLNWRLHKYQDFPGDAGGKEPACQCIRCKRRRFDPGSERSPGGGHSNPLHYSCLENPHWQRNLEGYSPWESQRVAHDWSDSAQQSTTKEGTSQVALVVKNLPANAGNLRDLS